MLDICAPTAQGLHKAIIVLTAVIKKVACSYLFDIQIIKVAVPF